MSVHFYGQWTKINLSIISNQGSNHLIANDTHILEENEDMMQESKENGIFLIVFIGASNVVLYGTLCTEHISMCVERNEKLCYNFRK